jgi:hypothetical protein
MTTGRQRRDIRHDTSIGGKGDLPGALSVSKFFGAVRGVVSSGAAIHVYLSLMIARQADVEEPEGRS